MDEYERIFQMFADGDLVFANPEQEIYHPSFNRVLQAYREGKLIGANGMAVAFAECKKCDWKGHNYFVIGDEDREAAYHELERKHWNARGCNTNLEFKEKSR